LTDILLAPDAGSHALLRRRAPPWDIWRASRLVSFTSGLSEDGTYSWYGCGDFGHGEDFCGRGFTFGAGERWAPAGLAPGPFLGAWPAR